MTAKIRTRLSSLFLAGAWHGGSPTEPKPFPVRISVNDRNIRKGAGTTFARTSKYTGKGVFTIVETKEGPGSDSGWGKLKSGAGWIALDYAMKV